MKILKSIFSLVLIIAIFLATMNFTIEASTNETPKEVLVAAQKGLEILKKVIASNPKKYGFVKEELNDIKLGKNYQINEISKLKFDEFKSNKLADLIVERDRWEFIVEVNGIARTFLTIGKEGNEYKLVHFGGDATEFANTIEKQTGFLKKHLPKVVKIRDSYFLYNLNSKNESVLPCFSVKNSKSIEFNGISNEEEVEEIEVIDYLRKSKKEYDKLRNKK